MKNDDFIATVEEVIERTPVRLFEKDLWYPLNKEDRGRGEPYGSFICIAPLAPGAKVFPYVADEEHNWRKFNISQEVWVPNDASARAVNRFIREHICWLNAVLEGFSSTVMENGEVRGQWSPAASGAMKILERLVSEFYWERPKFDEFIRGTSVVYRGERGAATDIDRAPEADGYEIIYLNKDAAEDILYGDTKWRQGNDEHTRLVADFKERMETYDRVYLNNNWPYEREDQRDIPCFLTGLKGNTVAVWVRKKED